MTDFCPLLGGQKKSLNAIAIAYQLPIAKYGFPHGWLRTRPEADVREFLREKELPGDLELWNRHSFRPVEASEMEETLRCFREKGCRTVDEYVRIYVRQDVALLLR